MVKDPMVTRTVTRVEAKMLVVSKEYGTTFDEEINLFTTSTDREQLLKLAKKEYDDDNYEPVFIKTFDVINEVYGMPLSQFISLAEVVKRPPSQQPKNN